MVDDHDLKAVADAAAAWPPPDLNLMAAADAALAAWEATRAPLRAEYRAAQAALEVAEPYVGWATLSDPAARGRSNAPHHGGDTWGAVTAEPSGGDRLIGWSPATQAARERYFRAQAALETLPPRPAVVADWWAHVDAHPVTAWWEAAPSGLRYRLAAAGLESPEAILRYLASHYLASHVKEA